MKQYTTPEQTAKLIELGFEDPNIKVDAIIIGLNDSRQGSATFIKDFSIGELIEILPTYCNFWDVVDVKTGQREWNVGYIYAPSIIKTELVDALFDMIVKLKEKGVI